MPRIIAGSAGGRRLKVPPGMGTRPTADRTREALFSALAARIDLEGAAVLDLYAGCGALGLEALSRGASHALLVESDPRTIAVLRSNVADLGLTGATVLGRTVAAALTQLPPRSFDLVLADPPYVLPAAELVDALANAAAGGWLAADAVVMVERSSRDQPWSWPQGFQAQGGRRYGEAALWYGRWGQHDGAERTPASQLPSGGAD